MAGIKRDSLITLLEMVMYRLPDDESDESWSLKFYSKSREYIKSLLAKSRMIGVKLVSVRGMTATADVRAKVINIFVESDPCINVENIRNLFSYMQFRSIDISELELENVTDMSCWFRGCHKLKEVKFNRNTDFSKVRSIYEIFADCTSLKKVDLSFANFRSLESAGLAFFNCRELESISINKTFRPKSTAGIFNLCSHKHELELEMSRNTGMVF